MKTERNYRAFISYDQEDAEWGTWLQSALEAYPIPKSLIGSQGSWGAIPGSLRPVFRDRSDLPAGASYDAAIQSVIDKSDHLIVVCSPRSAKSTYVDDEIRRFKMSGRSGRILAIIVDGEPGDPQQECFPPSLRYKLAEDGSPTSQRAEPLAADARPHRDGRQLAFMKVVAGLLGIRLDDLIRREEVARRRRTRMWAGIAAAMAMLAVIATGSSVYAFKERGKANDRLGTALNAAAEFVNQAVSLSETYGVPRRRVVDLLNRADQIFRDLGQEATQDPDFQFSRAQMLMAFAKSFEDLGQTKLWRERSLEAGDILAKLTKTFPNDDKYAREQSRNLAILSEAELASGDATASEAAAKRSLQLAESHLATKTDSLPWRQNAFNAGELLARIARYHGRFDEALDMLRASAKERSDLLKTLGGDTVQKDANEIKRRLADVDKTIGDILLFEKSEPAQARTAYTAGRDILAELRQADPSNATTRWLLADATAQIASSHLDEDAYADALKGFLEAGSIVNELAQGDPDNVQWKVGQLRLRMQATDAQRGLGRTAEVESELKELLGLTRGLAGRYPDTPARRFGVGEIEFRFGVLAQDRRDFAGCISQSAAAVATFDTALAASPGNQQWQLARDRAVDLRDRCTKQQKAQ